VPGKGNAVKPGCVAHLYVLYAVQLL